MLGFNITYNATTGKLTVTNTDDKNFIKYNSTMFRLLSLDTSASNLVSQSYVFVGNYLVNIQIQVLLISKFVFSIWKHLIDIVIEWNACVFK